MAGRRPQRPPPASLALDYGEPDDEQNAGGGEEGGAQDELSLGEGRKRAAGDGRRLSCQIETSARMSGRSIPNRDPRKNAIRKLAAGRKGRIRPTPSRRSDPYNFLMTLPGLQH